MAGRRRMGLRIVPKGISDSPRDAEIQPPNRDEECIPDCGNDSVSSAAKGYTDQPKSDYCGKLALEEELVHSRRELSMARRREPM